MEVKPTAPAAPTATAQPATDVVFACAINLVKYDAAGVVCATFIFDTFPQLTFNQVSKWIFFVAGHQYWEPRTGPKHR